MNEQIAKLGNQLKGAVTKVTVTWKEQEPKRKRLIVIIAAAVLVLAIGIAIALNVYNGRYVVLDTNLTEAETVQAKGILETNSVPSRLSNGVLEVPSKNLSQAAGLLALEGIPSATLDYDVLAAASGLTTTEFEKNKAWIHQQQNRLQDIIKTFDGVQNAYVTLNVEDQNTKVWDASAKTSSGSVQVIMNKGYVLGTGQVEAIRSLVGAAMGIDPVEITVTDGNGNLLAASGQEYSSQVAVAQTLLERMSLQTEVENDLNRKAASIMQQVYPNSALWTISCTVELDWDAMMTEIKEYMPLEGTIHGVLDYEEDEAQMGVGQFAEGVVGETDNTDVPIYVDLDGDGTLDSVDYHRIRDYAVSYTLQQIEKDGPTRTGASMAVVINDTPNTDRIQNLRTSIANATNLPLENVSVQSFLVETEEEAELTWIQNLFGEDFNPLILYIIIAGLVAIVIALVVILILRNKAKKKKLELELAEAAAEQEEADRIAREIEERKNQLKNAALDEASEDAITGEVREFARNNPEITANLLRNWLKEGD